MNADQSRLINLLAAEDATHSLIRVLLEPDASFTSATNDAKDTLSIYAARIHAAASAPADELKFLNFDDAMKSLKRMHGSEPVTVTIVLASQTAIIFTDPTFSRLIGTIETIAPSIAFQGDYERSRENLAKRRMKQLSPRAESSS